MSRVGTPCILNNFLLFVVIFVILGNITDEIIYGGTLSMWYDVLLMAIYTLVEIAAICSSDRVFDCIARRRQKLP